MAGAAPASLPSRAFPGVLAVLLLLPAISSAQCEGLSEDLQTLRGNVSLPAQALARCMRVTSRMAVGGTTSSIPAVLDADFHLLTLAPGAGAVLI